MWHRGEGRGARGARTGVGEVEGPAKRSGTGVSTSEQWAMGTGVAGRCAHRVLLRVVAEALGHDGVAEEEGEVGEDIVARGGDGAGGGQLLCPVYVVANLSAHGCCVRGRCAGVERVLWWWWGGCLSGSDALARTVLGLVPVRAAHFISSRRSASEGAGARKAGGPGERVSG